MTRDVRYGNKVRNEDANHKFHHITSKANLHEKQQKEELAGGNHTAHEESDGNAGVKSSHDHCSTDAQSDDNYGRSHGREGFRRRAGRYRPEGHEGYEQGKGQDGVPFLSRGQREQKEQGVLLRCMRARTCYAAFFSAPKIRMTSPEGNIYKQSMV